jgi:hypothetical protein
LDHIELLHWQLPKFWDAFSGENGKVAIRPDDRERFVQKLAALAPLMCADWAIRTFLQLSLMIEANPRVKRYLVMNKGSNLDPAPTTGAPATSVPL